MTGPKARLEPPRNRSPLTLMQTLSAPGAQARGSFRKLAPFCPSHLSSPSFSLSIRTFFRATISSVWVSRARSGMKTHP